MPSVFLRAFFHVFQVISTIAPVEVPDQDGYTQVMAATDLPYLPGSPAGPFPLGRFLPFLPKGMVAAWLQQNLTQGEWLLDPLGSSPQADIEAAKAGYKVLAVCKNPVTAFILRMMASSVANARMISALADLGSSRKGDQRLDLHFRALYETRCLNCNQLIQADEYRWRRGDTVPSSRIYHCPFCHHEGEFPPGPEDLAALALAGNDALVRARALERLNFGGQPNPLAGEAVGIYLARPLYFIFQVLSRMEGFFAAPELQDRLRALLLVCMDEGCSLSPSTASKSRPKQLTAPPIIREKNLWKLMDEAVKLIATGESPVPITFWPDITLPDPGICLYQGRLTDLLPLPARLKPSAVVSVLPRPNQAYWALSALWTAWLWGKQAAFPLRGALQRKRYNWDWHTGALYHNFHNIRNMLQTGIPVFTILPELSTGFLAASYVAARGAGFNLTGLAMRSSDELAQMTFQVGPDKLEPHEIDLEQLFRLAIQDHLSQTNQPADALTLTGGCITRLSAFPIPMNEDRFPNLKWVNDIQRSWKNIFSTAGYLVRYHSLASEGEAGLFWFPESGLITDALPLNDRIEMEVLDLLRKYSKISVALVEQELCRKFPGVMPPSREYLVACMESYASPIFQENDTWELLLSETTAAREKDLQTIVKLVHAVGNRLGFTAAGENNVQWKDQNGNIVYNIYVITSSVIFPYISKVQPVPNNNCILILPGSRSALLARKLKRDPRLAALSEGWRFIKFRHLRLFHTSRENRLAEWEKWLEEDQPGWEEATQIPLIKDEA